MAKQPVDALGRYLVSTADLCLVDYLAALKGRVSSLEMRAHGSRNMWQCHLRSTARLWTCWLPT